MFFQSVQTLVDFRRCLCADVPRIVTLDGEWSERKIRKTLAKPYTNCILAVYSGSIMGFAIYQWLESGEMVLHRLAVAENVRRERIGMALVENLKKKMNANAPKISASVEDSNLSAHLFLRVCGFRATGIQGSNYRFIYRYRKGAR